MDRQFAQFTEAVEWNLVRREELVAQEVFDGRGLIPIPPRNFGCDRHVLLIGVATDIPAGRRWKTGGWAEQLSFQSPSSTTQFQPPIKISSRWLSVNRLNLVIFPKLGTVPYLCQISVPTYFKQALVECWKYDGPDESLFDRLSQIESQIN